MYRKILIATDGSPLSEIGVTHGIDLARQLNADALLVTVTEPFHVLSSDPGFLTDTPEEYRSYMRARAERVLRPATERAAAAGVAARTLHLECEQPYAGIITAAQDNGCDLIVMSSHGRHGLSAVLLGSETTKVLTHSAVPVLVVREDGERAARPAPAVAAFGASAGGGIPEGIVMAPRPA